MDWVADSVLLGKWSGRCERGNICAGADAGARWAFGGERDEVCGKKGLGDQKSQT